MAYFTDIPQDEGQALIDLYNATKGPSWTRRTGWATSGTLTAANFYGITVSAGHVAGISLFSNNLDGTLPNMRAIDRLVGHCRFDNNPKLKGDVYNLPRNSPVGYQCDKTQMSGDIANLPKTGRDYYMFNESNVSGDIANLPPGVTQYDFSDTNVSGNISVFASLSPSCLTYKFNNTNVSGNISNLPDGAHYYWFTNTNVSGTTSDLPTAYPTVTMPFTQYLFSGTNITGNVANIPNAGNFYEFDDTDISGDVSGLPVSGTLYSITRWSFRNTNLSGNTSDIPDSKAVQLYFSGTNITGTTATIPLSKSTTVGTYEFNNTNISGDVANLRFSGAASISFNSCTNITGDVADIPFARWLDFGFTSVSGDVSGLQDLAYLYNFQSTNVSGATSDLPTPKSNQYKADASMNFNDTDISGDVNDIPDGVYNYYFSNTNVNGNVANLPVSLLAPKVQRYHFNNTNVSGDIANLPTGASEYKFNNTNVTGSINNAPSGGTIYWFGDTSISGSPNTGSLSSATSVRLYNCPNVTPTIPWYSIQELWLYDNSYTQNEVTALLGILYNYRNQYTYEDTIELKLDNGASSTRNAAPNGIYQKVLNPTTGQEAAYALEHPEEYLPLVWNPWSIDFYGKVLDAQDPTPTPDDDDSETPDVDIPVDATTIILIDGSTEIIIRNPDYPADDDVVPSTAWTGPNTGTVPSSQIGVAAGSIAFSVSYYSDEHDISDIECEMRIGDNTYEMYNNDTTGGGGVFTYIFPNYLSLPSGPINMTFTFSNQNLSPQLLKKYTANTTVRQSLDDFMFSNILNDTTAETNVIFDIPVIQKEYYDSIDTNGFDTSVLQTFLSTVDIENYRMSTDFMNVKMCNTYGVSRAMLRNYPNKNPVSSRTQNTVPTNPALAARYIINGNEGGEWANRKDQIAQCIDASAVVWTYTTPISDDMVKVIDEDTLYIYTDFGWVKPIYELPLRINLEVFRDKDSTIEDAALAKSIRSSLITAFQDRFGPNASLYRSEIIDIVQGTSGVVHCRILEPESNIFFDDIDIDEFTQRQLLEYTPDYIYFTEDSITVSIFVD